MNDPPQLGIVPDAEMTRDHIPAMAASPGGTAPRLRADLQPPRRQL